MTTTIRASVDGKAIIADEPTPSPLKDRAGGPVMFNQIRTLLLEDGSTVYGCAHCDYTAEKWTSIRPHLSKHKTAAPPVRDLAQTLTAMGMTLGELLEEHKRANILAATVERQINELAELRAQLRDYNALKKALGKLGVSA